MVSRQRLSGGGSDPPPKKIQYLIQSYGVSDEYIQNWDWRLIQQDFFECKNLKNIQFDFTIKKYTDTKLILC